MDEINFTPENMSEEYALLVGRVQAVIAYCNSNRYGVIHCDAVANMLKGGGEDGVPVQDYERR